MKNHSATKKEQKILKVLLPLPVGDCYDYGVPKDQEMPPKGSFVEVPFGKKTIIGVVWKKGTSDLPPEKLKEINRTLDLPPLSNISRQFVDWVANYTLTPPGLVFKMLLGGKLREAKKKDVLPDLLANPDHYQPKLTADQQKSAAVLCQQIKEQKFTATLLDGVTGSGKTEVYCEAIAEALRQGKQVVVLLPEISMTAALIDRFTQRFGIEPTLWHSNITEKQRRLNWHAIIQNKARFILGARSALFLPYVDLGLIVVDEEHESAYKQEEGVIYHGRDMAVVRAHLGNIPIILASATPSLETFLNVQNKRYDHVVLKERFGGATLPQIGIIDLRKEKLPATRFISEKLKEELEKTLAQGKQAMLFLNRRGYAPLTLCRACGHRLQCPHCTSWLIRHKRTGKLQCHQCNYQMPFPKKCPNCEAEDRLAACGPGVERIAEEIKDYFPNIRSAIMASDTMSKEGSAKELVQQMQDQTLDLLIGTQIMAKGYHFPRLTLVGVIDADLGLGGSDPRAAERTFQLLQQVAGRSGRAQDKGFVYLQTTDPENPVMRALIKGDRNAFMDAEIAQRSAFSLPPFCRLANITVSGQFSDEVEKTAREIAAKAPSAEKIRILGPAPAPFTILRGKTRYRLLVRAPKNIDLSRFIRNWLSQIKIKRTLRIQIDIDPYSFL